MTPKAHPTSKDEESIQTRTQEFATAWNRHDVHAMSEIFAEDGDLINPFGKVAKSRAEVERLIGEEHAGPLKSSRISIKPENVRVLSSEIAIADSAYEITGARDPSGKEVNIRGHLTQVLKKQAGRWAVVSARPMVPLSRTA